MWLRAFYVLTPLSIVWCMRDRESEKDASILLNTSTCAYRGDEG